MKKISFLVSAFLILLAGCKNKSTADLQDHDHEDVYLQLVAYSEDFELFAEAEPFAAGKPSTILAHFTSLSDFKPLEESSITVSLITGTKGVRQTIEKPIKPGIYVFRLTPAVAGKARIVFGIKNPKGEFQVTVPGIFVYGDSHDALHTAEDQIIEDPNAISFTKEQSWKFDFATDFPAYDFFGQMIRTVAQVVPAQSDEIIVSAKASGKVIFTDQFLLDGQQVHTGQNLLRISGSEMADNNFQVRFEEARNNFTRTKAEYERSVSLAEERIISEKDLLQAKNEYENTRVVYENLLRNFEPDGQTVKSPSEGFVGQVFVKSGDYVEAGQALLRLNLNKMLILRATVRQKFLSDLPGAVSANVRGMHDGEVYTISPLGKDNFSYGKVVDPDNFLVPVSIVAGNDLNLLPGSLTEIFLKTLSREKAISVPNTALLEEQGNHYVFVQLTPELFEKREIRVSATDGIRTKVSHGLAATDRIVTRGPIWIKLSQSSGALDPHAGHVH